MPRRHRSTSPSRRRRRSRELVVEGLEQRRLLAANVAVASDAGPASSPFVRLVDAESGAERASVMAFESTFKGGVRLAMGRITGNAAPDIVAGSGSGRVAEVRVFKTVTSGATTTLQQVLSFQPFGPSYRGGIEVAVGNVDGDADEDIIVSKSREGGDVRVFRMTSPGGTLTQTLYATIAKPFGAAYTGGSSVAAADVGTFSAGSLVNAAQVDDKVEIVVASGVGTAARVLVYDVSNVANPRVVDTIRPTLPSWFKGGLSVASARYNRDFVDDIVVSVGRGGGSQTFVYDGTVSTAANTVLKSFAAYASLARPNAAVSTAPVDLNGDGYADRFMATQGDPGGVPGISNVSTAGVRSGAVSNLSGPMRVAAARTFLATRTVSATVSSSNPPAGVTPGSVHTMQYRDSVVGTGAVAENGKRLAVNYVGRLVSTLPDGTPFDTGTLPNATFPELVLGAGTVIKGWDAGLVGMKVGGKRLLVIPPELAYGYAARTNIPAGSTLAFEVELTSVT